MVPELRRTFWTVVVPPRWGSPQFPYQRLKQNWMQPRKGYGRNTPAYFALNYSRPQWGWINTLRIITYAVKSVIRPSGYSILAVYTSVSVRPRQNFCERIIRFCLYIIQIIITTGKLIHFQKPCFIAFKSVHVLCFTRNIQIDLLCSWKITHNFNNIVLGALISLPIW